METQEIQQRVLQNGKPLDLDKFSWDKTTKTFSTAGYNLVCDFGGLYGLKIIAGRNCTFKTGSKCSFETGGSCTFHTDWGCTFEAGWGCTFKTGSKCVCVRRDVFEFFEIPDYQKIKLNPSGEQGYQLINNE